MQAMTVITGPRTGAGHLFALLQNVEAVATCDGLSASGPDGVPEQMARAEADAEAQGKSLLVLRATSALPRELVERDLLGRSDMRMIFVVRRQIDAYVSLAKAMALSAWCTTDLTAVRVKLDVPRFARWLEEQEAWYAHWKVWLERRGLPVPVIRYESHLAVPAEAALRRFATVSAQVGIPLRVPATLPHPGLTQQDRGRTVAAKIRNWPEFSRGLVEAGIEKRAFGYPI